MTTVPTIEESFSEAIRANAGQPYDAATFEQDNLSNEEISVRVVMEPAPSHREYAVLCQKL